MDVASALKSQYHAALKTLRQAIEECPETLWDDPADGLAPFWRVVYHTLFYTHYYLQKDEHSLVPWAKHREEANFLNLLPWDNLRPPRSYPPYTRDELLEYWRLCEDAVDGSVDALDLSAPECGFSWYQVPKLEHQIVNIRHIQNHAAALATRLRRAEGIDIGWVQKG